MNLKPAWDARTAAQPESARQLQDTGIIFIIHIHIHISTAIGCDYPINNFTSSLLITFRTNTRALQESGPTRKDRHAIIVRGMALHTYAAHGLQCTYDHVNTFFVS